MQLMFLIFIFIFFTLCFPSTAFAYVGPAVGIFFLGAILIFVLLVALLVISFLYKFIKKLKNKDDEKEK